ncbi:hypothetical protein L195_g028780 [Trifolium pratense]|uniref:Reverse transcriptase domain-containing protein n=1 Tax=Trifolium pratense TaxID=57577 RepID=A0A2K3L2W4_TRIPR|nr:hypothetical protein L195_g028780 [Trifolium pratense]
MLRTDGEQVLFNVFEAMKQHDDDPYLEEEWEKEIEICLNNLNANRVDENPRVENIYEVKASDGKKEESKVPELKQLPSHLKYVFLSEDASLPAIVSSTLTKVEEEKLLRVLRSNKEAMGWSISDLKGISPTFCMHKIKLEEEFKAMVQPQRRLNPPMKEVVKKEVLKLLEAGMIYPISDSSWISPVHVVPKKGGMTVVRNDKNELIQSRTITGTNIQPSSEAKPEVEHSELLDDSEDINFRSCVYQRLKTLELVISEANQTLMIILDCVKIRN